MQVLDGFVQGAPSRWSEEDIESWRMPEENTHEGFKLKFSKYNPTPGREGSTSSSGVWGCLLWFVFEIGVIWDLLSLIMMLGQIASHYFSALPR
jgi:tetrahydromethanopterin S-methyltransferase subunit B